MLPFSAMDKDMALAVLIDDDLVITIPETLVHNSDDQQGETWEVGCDTLYPNTHIYIIKYMEIWNYMKNILFF